MHNQKSSDKELVLNALDYTIFYERYMPELKVNGRKEVKTLCPLHPEKHPSFSVNLETGLYNCFSNCGGGDAIRFIEKLYSLSFKEALGKIKADEGITDTKTPKAAKKTSTTPPKKSVFLTADQIGTLHRQLIKNEEALNLFMGKYGLGLPTIEKYLIGYQNERFVIPIEVEPGKWTFKEHKGLQLKGSHVSLYPSAVIKEGLPYIVAEGEFKALVLIQHGFQAASGTGGANTWKKEWNARLANLDVIIAYDNDEKGRLGAQKVAESLSGTAKSVKTIQWPAMLDGSKDRKDVTDYFVTLGKTKADFQRLIENAQDLIREIKEIGGIKFIEPEDYKIREDRVDQIIFLKDGPKPKPICFTPLLITGCALDVDTGTEEVEITFKQRWRWKKIWAPKRTIMDMKKLVELSDHGLQVSSVNVKRMIEYLSFFEAYNMNFIELSYIARGMGWKTIRDRKVFILNKMISKTSTESCQNNEEISVEFVAEAGFERFVKAMKPRGTYSQWRECVSKALKYPYASFAFYASFAAPLLRILKAPNFIIDFWGGSSVGKTTVSELAASVWGNPHKESGGLVFSWDSTKVFLERMASFFCDVPIFPDDSQTVDDRTLATTLYMIANGVGKGRGAPTGVRRNATWHTVCYSNGERPLTSCTSFSGAQARTIEIYGSPFPNAGGDFIRDLKQGIRENYGHAGPKFIKGLLSIIENPFELDALKNEYRRYQQMLSKQAGSEIGDRISQYFSVIKVASALACKILDVGDPVEAEEAIFKVFKDILQETLTHSDLPARAMDYILSWVMANENYFRWNDRGEQFGRIIKGDYVGIFRHKFTEVLKKENYSEMAVLRGWFDRDWIKREDPSHFTCSRKITDIIRTWKDDKGEIHEIKEIKNTRLIIIPWHVVDRFQGNDKKSV